MNGINGQHRRTPMTGPTVAPMDQNALVQLAATVNPNRQTSQLNGLIPSTAHTVFSTLPGGRPNGNGQVTARLPHQLQHLQQQFHPTMNRVQSATVLNALNGNQNFISRHPNPPISQPQSNPSAAPSITGFQANLKARASPFPQVNGVPQTTPVMINGIVNSTQNYIYQQTTPSTVVQES
jgi:hypothetical protein